MALTLKNSAAGKFGMEIARWFDNLITLESYCHAVALFVTHRIH